MAPPETRERRDRDHITISTDLQFLTSHDNLRNPFESPLDNAPERPELPSEQHLEPWDLQFVDADQHKKKIRLLCALLATCFALLIVVTGVLVGLLVWRDNTLAGAAPNTTRGANLTAASATYNSGSGPTPTYYGSYTSTTATVPPSVAQQTSTAQTPTAMLSNTGLAAVAWKDSHGFIQYRVYYQNNKNYIQESAWNSSFHTWYVSNRQIALARTSTPISATVDPSTFSMNVFYVSPTGLIESSLSTDTFTWQAGNLGSSPLTAGTGSNIASAWYINQNCQSCHSSLLIIYSHSNGTLRIHNQTADNWSMNDLPINATPGSGVSLTLIAQDVLPPQLRLFYQSVEGNVVAASWISDEQAQTTDNNANTAGWNLDENTALSHPPLQSPLTSFAFGKTTSTANAYGNITGLPQVVNALTATPSGVNSITWLPDGTSTWLPASNPAAMSTITNTSAIASHTYASAYAVVNNTLFEYTLSESDFVTWDVKGSVPTD